MPALQRRAVHQALAGKLRGEERPGKDHKTYRFTLPDGHWRQTKISHGRGIPTDHPRPDAPTAASASPMISMAWSIWASVVVTGGTKRSTAPSRRRLKMRPPARQRS